jgi:DNA-binding MarR family transcriptional regulator
MKDQLTIYSKIEKDIGWKEAYLLGVLDKKSIITKSDTFELSLDKISKETGFRKRLLHSLLEILSNLRLITIVHNKGSLNTYTINRENLNLYRNDTGSPFYLVDMSNIKRFGYPEARLLQYFIDYDSISRKKYFCRTVKNISSDTGFSANIIKSFLKKFKDLGVIKSYIGPSNRNYFDLDIDKWVDYVEDHLIEICS